jgi:CHASE2 domain/CHAT domain
MKFQLKVQKIEQICLFELAWGQSQQLNATLNYSPLLAERYQEWRRIYLSFYRTADIPLFPTNPSPDESPPDESLRGWTIAQGRLTPTNWHTKLAEAELNLLSEFHYWLRSAELFEIRAQLARASQEISSDRPSEKLDLFLTCTPIELARMPWETWEIGADFAATGAIRIVRTASCTKPNAVMQQPRGRVRILAILGDDTGLDFQTDREAVRSLSSVATVQFEGWQPGQTATEVKAQIRDAIAAEPGWDVLFFAGHSNETEVAGGELIIAPNVSIPICEIALQLIAAKERRLQVAIFNSCSGLNIADSLINLGLSQVVVMREPIHNRVAQEFLVQFVRGLANRQDLHESLLAACRSLRLEKNLTYPSAYLVPSLFCHPDAAPFRIATSWRQRFQKLLPTRLEAIALAIGVALSLSPAQSALLNARVWAEAVYRDHTGQVPALKPPPVALVQIDKESIGQARLSKLSPIDRTYLAKLLDRLTELKASVVGIDFVLDAPAPQPEADAALSKSVQTAVKRNGTWIVFGALLDEMGETGVNQQHQISSLNWSLQGYIDATIGYVMLPYPGEDCRQTCPFTYLLSLVHTTHQYSPQPALNRSTDLRSQFLNTIDSRLLQNLPQSRSQNKQLTALRQLHLLPISVWSYDAFSAWLDDGWKQHWLEPIIDFSIPSDRAYDQIPAWQLLDSTRPIADLSKQIVLISPGDDDRLGMVSGDPDRYPVPMALRYWHPQNWLTGGEANAYMIYHQLTQRFVVPIPDLWMMGIAVLLGKGVIFWFESRSRWTKKQRRRYILASISATALYGIASLQLYISAAILLPVVLPTAIFWIYIFPALRRKNRA